MIKILFLGADNAGFSLMAESMAKARKVADMSIESADVQAGAPQPRVAEVMAEIGVPLAGSRIRAVSALKTTAFDIVILVSGPAEDPFGSVPGHPHRIEWKISVPDKIRNPEKIPVEEWRKVRDEIKRLVDDFFERGYLLALAEAKKCETLILDNIFDGIIVHNMERRILYFNKAAEDITGYSAQEVLYNDCHAVFPGNFCGGHCLFCNGQTPDVSFKRQELEITTKGGERRSIEMLVKALVDGRGKTVGVLASFRDMTREKTLARRVGAIEHFSGIIGRDHKMLEVFDLIRDLADSNAPVLIHGESGTGKELVAAAIHNEGVRASKQFVPVNCGALPEALLESELFGHVKGAFTGAIRDKKGRFELADGGTIFLDEIGDISPAMQVKLLRVLQEGTFERVGSEKTMRVSVRLISATNKDLAKEIAAGRFREDLYYRLNVVPLYLPPLRERRNDIPILVNHIMSRLQEETKKPAVEVSPDALDALLSYDWPGNVRELQNWLQFALVKSRGSAITAQHLPPVPGGPPRQILSRRKRKLDMPSLEDALKQANGNKLKAAEILGVSRATLYRFLDDNALPPENGRN